MTITLESEQIRRGAPVMLWLDLTRRCQPGCAHCFNASGPAGDHGTMARGDWVRVLDQAAAWESAASSTSVASRRCTRTPSP